MAPTHLVYHKDMETLMETLRLDNELVEEEWVDPAAIRGEGLGNMQVFFRDDSPILDVEVLSDLGSEEEGSTGQGEGNPSPEFPTPESWEEGVGVGGYFVPPTEGNNQANPPSGDYVTLGAVGGAGLSMFAGEPDDQQEMDQRRVERGRWGGVATVSYDVTNGTSARTAFTLRRIPLQQEAGGEQEQEENGNEEQRGDNAQEGEEEEEDVNVDVVSAEQPEESGAAPPRYHEVQVPVAVDMIAQQHDQHVHFNVWIRFATVRQLDVDQAQPQQQQQQ